MKIKWLFLFLLTFFCATTEFVFSQTEETEQIIYYQMEPYDDSLFIKIQEEVFIDPPDPKAEIIVDLRDVSNQTISIKGALYPFLSFSPETRARIITFPFKINLLDDVNFGSVFTRVFAQIKFNKLFEPPRKSQIISSMSYINPYLQFYGGRRFGVPFKDDLGITFGLGTPFATPRETNFAEANFHIVGFYVGAFYPVKDIFAPKQFKNNMVCDFGLQVGYVLPFGNFFEIGYQKSFEKLSVEKLANIYGTDAVFARILTGSFLNWEFRYPFRTLGASRAIVYLARYQAEWHFGFDGKELSLAGSTFDLRYNFLFKSPDRKKQHLIEIFVQKIASSWGFSSFALGPSVVLGLDKNNKFNVTSFFVNGRLKVGTSF